MRASCSSRRAWRGETHSSHGFQKAYLKFELKDAPKARGLRPSRSLTSKCRYARVSRAMNGVVWPGMISNKIDNYVSEGRLLPICPSIRRTNGLRLSHEENSIECRSKAFNSFYISDEMRDQNAIKQHAAPGATAIWRLVSRATFPTPFRQPKNGAFSKYMKGA